MATSNKKAAAAQRPSSPQPTETNTMQLVHFTEDFYDSGVVKFAADSYHPLNSETQSLVTTGYAALVDSDDTTTQATVLAALAKIAGDRADAAEEQALALRAEADKAQRLAKAAAGRQADAAVSKAAADAEAAAAEAKRVEEEAAAAAEAQRKAQESAAAEAAAQAAKTNS